VADRLEDHVARCGRVIAGLEQAEAAYRTVLESRDALRGLLGAYRDRQLARAANRDLDAAYGAAKEAAYLAPCDLDAARRLVDAYVTAVRAATPPGTVAPERGPGPFASPPPTAR
jgi:hypothetical protein